MSQKSSIANKIAALGLDKEVNNKPSVPSRVVVPKKAAPADPPVVAPAPVVPQQQPVVSSHQPQQPAVQHNSTAPVLPSPRDKAAPPIPSRSLQQRNLLPQNQAANNNSSPTTPSSVTPAAATVENNNASSSAQNNNNQVEKSQHNRPLPPPPRGVPKPSTAPVVHYKQPPKSLADPVVPEESTSSQPQQAVAPVSVQPTATPNNHVVNNNNNNNSSNNNNNSINSLQQPRRVAPIPSQRLTKKDLPPVPPVGNRVSLAVNQVNAMSGNTSITSPRKPPSPAAIQQQIASNNAAAAAANSSVANSTNVGSDFVMVNGGEDEVVLKKSVKPPAPIIPNSKKPILSVRYDQPMSGSPVAAEDKKPEAALWVPYKPVDTPVEAGNDSEHKKKDPKEEEAASEFTILYEKPTSKQLKSIAILQRAIRQHSARKYLTKLRMLMRERALNNM